VINKYAREKKPTDHHRNYIKQLKQQQKKNKIQKRLTELNDSKNVFKMSRFRNVGSSIKKSLQTKVDGNKNFLKSHSKTTVPVSTRPYVSNKVKKTSIIPKFNLQGSSSTAQENKDYISANKSDAFKTKKLTHRDTNKPLESAFHEGAKIKISERYRNISKKETNNGKLTRLRRIEKLKCVQSVHQA